MPTTLPENSPPPTSSGKTIFEHLEDPQATALLPSLQSVVNGLQSLTRRGDTSIQQITELVQMDQSMSMRVLRIANSAYYAPSTPIMDVQEAILYIGLSTLRGAVASAQCLDKTSHIRQDVLDWKDFWIHAAGVAQITMELASRLKYSDTPAESFYLMGLLHDIGKVVLACLMPAEFNEIYTRAGAEKLAPCALEMECLGVEHGHLGAWYLEKQGIPLTLREPVRFHHSGVLDDKKPFSHASLVRLADRMAIAFELGQSGNTTLVGDPFLSAEWKWYLKKCAMTEADGNALKWFMIEQVARISDLVRKIIV